MSSNEETTSRPLPAAVSVPLILLCLFGGGWIIKWYVMTDALASETKILGDAPAPPARNNNNGNRGGGNFAFFGSSIRDQGNGRYQYSGNKIKATARLNGKPGVTLMYVDYKEIDAPSHKTIQAARMLTEGGDHEMIKAMKISDDQLHQIQGLASTPEAQAPQADRDEVLADFTAWKNAPEKDKADIQKKLSAKLDDIAAKSMEATKAEMMNRAQKINAIVTPEQWKVAATMGAGT